MKGRDGTVRAMPVEHTDMATLKAVVSEHVDLAATVYTDEFGGYNTIPQRRETVCHSAGEYVRSQAHTNGIGVVLGTAEAGMGWHPSLVEQAPLLPLRGGMCAPAKHHGPQRGRGHRSAGTTGGGQAPHRCRLDRGLVMAANFAQSTI